MNRRRAAAAALVALATVLALSCTGPPRMRHRPDLDESWLVPANVLQRWNEDKARLGPTFAGSPAWHRHMEFLERELSDRGLEKVTRDPVPYQRWHTAEDAAAGRWSLTVDGRPVPVASYWAYSGTTKEAGVTAPLVLYDPKQPPDIAGKIVVFEVPALPDPPPPMFQPPTNAFATADLGEPGIATDQWYQSNYPTRFGRFDNVLKEGKAAGGLVIFDMGPGRARGLYTFPLLNPEPSGVPGLYLDRVAGAPVREAARAGKSATLRLIAATEPADAYFLWGYLPGRNFRHARANTEADADANANVNTNFDADDQLVLLVTHTDGPNVSQENGALAILSVIDYYAKIPPQRRRRTLLVLLDPQHYMPGRHLVDWYANHPQIAARIVASVGAEQFGQREYAERGDDFVLTGRPETTLIFSQDNPRLVQTAIDAVQKENLPRTAVRVPSRGQGQWAGLGDVALKRHIPGFATSTDMSAYWSTAPGIESFDADLCRRQVAVLLRLTDLLMTAPLADIAPVDRAQKHEN